MILDDNVQRRSLLLQHFERRYIVPAFCCRRLYLGFLLRLQLA